MKWLSPAYAFDMGRMGTACLSPSQSDNCGAVEQRCAFELHVRYWLVAFRLLSLRIESESQKISPWPSLPARPWTSPRQILTYQKADEIHNFCYVYIIVAHNAKFDLNFLNRELVRARKEMTQVQVIDSIEIARTLYPGRLWWFSSEELEIQHHAKHVSCLIGCSKRVLEFCAHQASMPTKEPMGRHMSGVTWQLVHPFECNCLFGP